MNYRYTTRLLRCFFLAWLGIIYLWELFRVILVGLTHLGRKSDLVASFCLNTDHSPNTCISASRFFQAIIFSIAPILLFTILMLFFGILLWTSLSHKQDQCFYWLTFLLEEGLAFAMAVVVSNREIAVVLTLMLALLALKSITQRYLLFILSCSAIVIFILFLMLSPMPWTSFFFLTPLNILEPLNILNTLEALSLLLFIFGFLGIYMQWIYAYTQLEIAHKELESTHVQLKRSYEQIATLTRLTERQRLARELHDTLAQGLAGLVMQLQVANAYQEEKRYEHAQAIIQQAIQRARTSLIESRQSIDGLRLTSTRANNLMEAIYEEISHFTHTTGIPCEMDLEALAAVAPCFREHVLRVITEGLTNITHHAHACHAWVQTVKHKDMIEIEIRDDGVGFDPAILSHTPGHYGLLGLRERTHLAGGLIDISSTLGSGTIIKLSLSARTEE